MQLATSIAQWLVRLTGITQIALGVLLWSGRGFQLLPLHMAVGMLFVIGLWVLAGLAKSAGLGMRWVAGAVIWGIVIPAFGMAQTQLLPGPAHWVVRVVHLLIGIAAMVIAALLARYIAATRDARPARARSPRPSRATPITF